MMIATTSVADSVRAAFPFSVDKLPLSGPEGLRTSHYGLFRSDTSSSQLAQLMHDRPEMARVLRGQPALREFLVCNFAGLDTGDRVAWDNREPEIAAPSEYRSPGGYPAGRVRITTRTYRSAEEKCALAVFELENARSRRLFESLRSMAWNGSINRDDYARRIVYLECQTGLRTGAFFREHPLPQQSTNRILRYCLQDPADVPKYMDFMEAHPELCNSESYRQHYDEIMRGKGGPDVPPDALKKSEAAYHKLFGGAPPANEKQQAEDYLNQLVGPTKNRRAAVDEVMKIINQKATADE